MIDLARLLPKLLKAAGTNPEMAEIAARLAWTRAAGEGLRPHAVPFRLFRRTNYRRWPLNLSFASINCWVAQWSTLSNSASIRQPSQRPARTHGRPGLRHPDQEHRSRRMSFQ